MEEELKTVNNHNKKIIKELKECEHKIKDVFLKSLSDTLEFKQVTVKDFEFKFPITVIDDVLKNNSSLNVQFNNFVSGFKDLKNDICEQLKQKVEDENKLIVGEKEIQDKVNLRKELFAEFDLHTIILEVTEYFWVLKKNADNFPPTYRALEAVSSKEDRIDGRRETSTYNIMANNNIYTITVVDTRGQTYLPDGDFWNNFKEEYSVKDDNGNILSEFKWSYQYDHMKSRESFRDSDITSFKPGNWVKDITELFEHMNIYKNQTKVEIEAETKANDLRDIKKKFDL